MFQVGQHPRAGPGRDGTATGVGSRLWLTETTSQAMGTHIAAMLTEESVQIAHRHTDVSWGFPRLDWESRGISAMQGNIFCLTGESRNEKSLFPHEIGFLCVCQRQS